MLNSSSVCSLQLDRTKLGVLLNRKKSGQLFRAQIFIDKLLFTAWHLDFWCFNLLRFSNLVHMFSVVVRGRRYILQLQAWLRKLLWDGFWLLIFPLREADVSMVRVNLSDSAQVQDLIVKIVDCLEIFLSFWRGCKHRQTMIYNQIMSKTSRWRHLGCSSCKGDFFLVHRCTQCW